MVRNTFEKPERPNLRVACPLARTPGALKRRTIWDIYHPSQCKISKKTFPDIEKFFHIKKLKIRILNSVTGRKKCKRGRLGLFNIHSVAKYQKNLNKDHLGQSKNFRKVP